MWTDIGTISDGSKFLQGRLRNGTNLCWYGWTYFCSHAAL